MSSSLPPRRKRRGPGRPPRSESRHTRSDIMASAQYHFSEMGFHATSLRQIAATANVDLATVKYHYDDKLELYNATFLQGHKRIVEHLIPEVSRLQEAKTRDAFLHIIRDITRASVELVKTDEAFVRLLAFRVLEDIDYPDAIREAYTRDIENTLTGSLTKVQSNGFMKDIDVQALIMLLAFSVPMFVLSAESYQRLAAPHPTDIASTDDDTTQHTQANDMFSAEGVEKLALKVVQTLLVASNA